MENCHPNEFTVAMMEKEKRKREIEGSCSNDNNNKKAKFDVMGACMKLVTIHDRPLSLIDDKAFRSIIAMIPQTEIINAHKVRNRITVEADIIR